MNWMIYDKGNKRWPSVGDLGKHAVHNPIVLSICVLQASKWLNNHGHNKDFASPVGPAMGPAPAPQSPMIGPQGQQAMMSPPMNGYDPQCVYQGGYAGNMAPQNGNGMPLLDHNGGNYQGGYSSCQEPAGYFPVQGSGGYPYASPDKNYGAYGSYQWK